MSDKVLGKMSLGEKARQLNLRFERESFFRSLNKDDSIYSKIEEAIEKYANMGHRAIRYHVDKDFIFSDNLIQRLESENLSVSEKVIKEAQILSDEGGEYEQPGEYYYITSW